jgi:hypothetical protein
VKQILILFAILIQSFGFNSVNAKATASTDTYFAKEDPSSRSVIIDTEDGGDIKRISKSSKSRFKIRTPRSFATAAIVANNFRTLHFPGRNTATGYTSPFYLPLVRLLLFPKHYFW